MPGSFRRRLRQPLLPSDLNCFSCLPSSQYIQVMKLFRRLIPGTGIVSRVPVLEQNHLPDFIDRQVLLPGRHDRSPGEAFVGQSDSTLRHTPEDECFLELGNRSRIREVCRDRVERERMPVSYTHLTLPTSDLV